MRTGLVSATAIAVLLQSGCSFMFVKGPPAQHAEMPYFDCSDSVAWPVVDAIWAGLNGIGAASAAGDDQIENQDQIVGVGIAWLVLSGISAIYGFSKVSQCSSAKQQRDQRYYGQPPPPYAPQPRGPYAPQPPGPYAPQPAPAPYAPPPPAAAPPPAPAPAPAPPAAAPAPPPPAAPAPPAP